MLTAMIKKVLTFFESGRNLIALRFCSSFLYTICDFVTSYRAPTPTGAAMRLSKDKLEVLATIYDKMSRLRASVKHKLIVAYNEYDHLLNSHALRKFDELIDTLASKFYILDEKIKLFSPEGIVSGWENNLNNYYERLNLGIKNALTSEHNSLEKVSQKLSSNLLLAVINNYEQRLDKLIEKSVLLNPFNVMEKGYAIIKQDGRILKSVTDTKNSGPLEVLMRDGKIETQSIKVINGGNSDGK